LWDQIFRVFENRPVDIAFSIENVFNGLGRAVDIFANAVFPFVEYECVNVLLDSITVHGSGSNGARGRLSNESGKLGLTCQ